MCRFKLATLFVFTGLCVLGGITSCSTANRYTITLKDGREFYAENRPEFHSKTGYYKFKNAAKKDTMLRADEVLMIHEM